MVIYQKCVSNKPIKSFAGHALRQSHKILQFVLPDVVEGPIVGGSEKSGFVYLASHVFEIEEADGALEGLFDDFFPQLHDAFSFLAVDYPLLDQLCGQLHRVHQLPDLLGSLAVVVDDELSNSLLVPAQLVVHALQRLIRPFGLVVWVVFIVEGKRDVPAEGALYQDFGPLREEFTQIDD